MTVFTDDVNCQNSHMRKEFLTNSIENFLVLRIILDNRQLMVLAHIYVNIIIK